jgi:hypothetical protein
MGEKSKIKIYCIHYWIVLAQKNSFFDEVNWIKGIKIWLPNNYNFANFFLGDCFRL